MDLSQLTDAVDNIGDQDLITVFWAAVVISLVLPRLPYGRSILYPFALLATWAHEMGHGLTAILAGGRFRRLEIHRDLGGMAWSSGVGRLGRALVAAGGLLAPACAGGLIIVLGARQSTAPFILIGLAVSVLASIVLFVRNRFGIIALGLISLLLVPLAVRAPETVRVFVAQLVGIQFCVASWGSLDYMFTKNFRHQSGRVIDSDTQTIAAVLLLPYWFWGGLIAAISLAILAGSFYVAWIMP